MRGYRTGVGVGSGVEKVRKVSGSQLVAGCLGIILRTTGPAWELRAGNPTWSAGALRCLRGQTPFYMRATCAGGLAAPTEAQMVNPALITLVIMN